MKKSLFALFSVALLSAPTVFADKNGGVGCAGCSVILGLVEQTAQINAIPITKAISQVCSLLPSPLDYTCSTLVAWYGPNLIKMLEDKYTPDVICNAIGVCNNLSGETCHIFPVPKAAASGARMTKVQFEKHVAEVKAKYDFSDYKFSVCDWIPNICNLGTHTPVFD